MKRISVVAILAMLGLTGCGVAAKVITVEREDQGTGGGNYGVVNGYAPQREPQEAPKKYRQIIEVDMTKVFDKENSQEAQ